ncbi:hypothetical protein AB1E18_008839 [Capra hircus]
MSIKTGILKRKDITVSLEFSCGRGLNEGRPGGRDNVAGLIAGRRPPSHLKFKLTRIALLRRRGPPRD